MLVVEEERFPLDGDAVALILHLNRPDSLNAMNAELVTGLAAGLERAEQDDRVRTVLITGRGRAFSAGGDLKAYRTLQRDPIAFPRFLDDLLRTFAAIRTMTKPVIALVNGITAAGGLELVLSCDFAYAGRSARIGDLHLNYGQMGGGGVLTLLPRAIGPARARELVFSGKLLTADEACAWGIVNAVVPDGELLSAGLEFARAIATKSSAAVAAAKYVMNVGWAEGTGVDSALRLERERNCLYVLTLPDAHDGLAAFAERRRLRAPKD